MKEKDGERGVRERERDKNRNIPLRLFTCFLTGSVTQEVLQL